eukprot:1811227-Rhodomonas_salina.1
MSPPEWNFILPDCPDELMDFAPDGGIITYAYPTSRAPSRIVIIEFARCYTIEEDEMLTAGAAKRNQYLHLTRFLQGHCPEYVVSYQSYIISVLGLYPLALAQSKWVENCESLDFTPAQTTKIQLEGVRACVLAGHALNNTARSRTEALRTGG